VYEELLAKLGAAGAEWVQIDEPYLALDLDARTLELYKSVYNRLSKASGDTKLILTTYFEALRENAETALNLPVDAVHIDLVRGEDQLTDLLPLVNDQMILSLGVVDGRNIWKNDYDKSLSKISDAVSVLGTDRVWVAPSCSLLHVPFDLDLEDNEAALPKEIKDWLAFAKQKLSEVSDLACLAGGNPDEATRARHEANRDSHERRRTSALIHRPDVKARVEAITDEDATRQTPFTIRKKKQQERF